MLSLLVLIVRVAFIVDTIITIVVIITIIIIIVVLEQHLKPVVEQRCQLLATCELRSHCQFSSAFLSIRAVLSSVVFCKCSTLMMTPSLCMKFSIRWLTAPNSLITIIGIYLLH